MRQILCIALFLLTGFACQAQSEQKKADIRKMQELTGSAKLGQAVMHRMLEISKEKYPEVDPQVWKEFEQGIKLDEMTELIIPIYDKYYTHAEIKELIAFYSTPLGQKLIKTMPAVLEEAMNVAQQWGQKLGEELVKKLQQKGYLKD